MWPPLIDSCTSSLVTNTPTIISDHGGEPLQPWRAAEQQPPEDDRHGQEHTGEHREHHERHLGDLGIGRDQGYQIACDDEHDREDHAGPQAERASESHDATFVSAVPELRSCRG